MRKRLLEIIQYKTKGNHRLFARFMDWNTPYLSQLLNRGGFGLRPVVSILERMPEINARWLLLGTGSMLDNEYLSNVRSDTLRTVNAILDLDRYVPYMTPCDLHRFQESIHHGQVPVFTPEERQLWQQRYYEHEQHYQQQFIQSTKPQCKTKNHK